MPLNSIFDSVDLSTLPPPEVIETLDFEVIYREVLTQFLALVPEYELLLESDPAVKVIQTWAYREMILRERINNAAKANLLAFATGGDLDQLGAFYNVIRLTIQEEDLEAFPPLPLIMEEDEAFRFRIQKRIMAWANAGGKAHYEYWALSASPLVRDAIAYSPDHENGYNMGGQVVVTVLSTEGDLVPSDELMSTVRTVVTRPDVKMLTDLVGVEPAIPKDIDLQVRVTLLPTTPYGVFAGLAGKFAAAFAERQKLGWDVTLSWVIRQFQADGVHGVDILHPSANVVVPPNEFARLTNLEVSFGGFADDELFTVSEMERRRALRLINEYYVNYAVSVKRSKADIEKDLAEKDVLGIMQPTIRGLIVFLGIENGQNAKGEWLPEDELAFLVWNKLNDKYYNATTPN